MDIRIQVFLVFVARLILTPSVVTGNVRSEALSLRASPPCSFRARDDLKVGSCIMFGMLAGLANLAWRRRDLCLLAKSPRHNFNKRTATNRNINVNRRAKVKTQHQNLASKVLQRHHRPLHGSSFIARLSQSNNKSDQPLMLTLHYISERCAVHCLEDGLEPIAKHPYIHCRPRLFKLGDCRMNPCGRSP